MSSLQFGNKYLKFQRPFRPFIYFLLYKTYVLQYEHFKKLCVCVHFLFFNFFYFFLCKIHLKILPVARGPTRMARGGIRLVHGHTKSPPITYFSGMKMDPKCTFLQSFFLICPSCHFQNLSMYRPKTHPFSKFCTFLHP